MLEGIYEIGNLILKDSDNSISSLIKNIATKKNGKQQYLICLNFKENYKNFNFDIKEIDENTKDKFIYIGNPKAANDPQDRLTTQNLKYLISQTIPNLINALNDCELKSILQKILNNYFIDLGNLSGQQRRYKYILDLNKIGINNIEINQIINEIKEKDKDNYAKEIVENFSAIIFEHIKSKYNISKKDISLFSILFEDSILAESNEYKNYIITSLSPKITDNNLENICFVCDSKKYVSYDTTKLRFTYYITDKIGFSSEFNGKTEKGFLKNFALCYSCLKKLLAGENFILNYLNFKLNNIDLLMIPKFLFKANINLEQIKELSNSFKDGFTKKLNLKSLKEIEEKLFNNFINEDNYINTIINLLFYKKDQSAFKIFKLIKDIPPSHFFNIIKTIVICKNDFKEFINKDDIDLTFEALGYLIVPRINNTKTLDFKKILNFYDSVLSNKPINYLYLINQFTNSSASIMLNSQTKLYSDKSLNLAFYIQKCLILLNILKDLNLIKIGGPMSYENLNVNKKIIDYIEKLNLNSLQAGLFLLGYLIGEIGNAQFRKGNKSKPILEKINYRGMDKNKILRLCNEIFEKLKEIKILEFNEKNYAEMKKLIDSNIKNWNLTDYENVFYILSGYSFSTLSIISSDNN